MELLSTSFSTALDSRHGLYLQSLKGTAIVCGPPIDVSYLDLTVDEPRWRRVDPRSVDFHAAQLRRWRQRVRISPREEYADPFAPRRRRPEPVSGRAAGHLRWFCQLLGPGRLRSLHALPEDAAGYLFVWLAQRVPEFDQLLQQAPMLAALIAGTPEGAELSLDDLLMSVREDSRLPRREVLAMRDLPPSAVRGFTRVTASAAELRFVTSLRKTLRDPPILKQWNHMRSIGPSAMRIFADARMFHSVSGGFLAELARVDRRSFEDEYARMLNQFVAVRALGEPSARRRFDSLRTLEAWHDRTGLSLNTSYLDEIMHLQFPRAPFDGDAHCIEQLLTGKDLMREALHMRHCAASCDYVEAMLAGDSFLFRAGGWGLERCTLEVQRRSRREQRPEGMAEFVVATVKGRENREVSRRTLSALRVWAEIEGIDFSYGSEEEMPRPPAAGDDDVPI